jgi:hypothetical protein
MEPSIYKLIQPISNGQLIENCKKFKYMIVRLTPTGSGVGINCKVVLLLALRKNPNPIKRSNVFSWYPADFSEYLTKKIPIYFT